MKRLSFALILILLGLSFTMAQEMPDKEKVDSRMRELRDYKINYLSKEMELTEAQKKKFVEVYQEMWEARKKCFKEVNHIQKKLKKDKNVPEEEYQKMTEARNKANADWSEIEKQYNEKFSAFLSQKQIYQMQEAETKFRAKIDEMKHSRRKDHGNSHSEKHPKKR